MEELSDLDFMREALKEAEIALDEGEIPVGAVVAADGKIIGRGHNTKEADRNPLRHAEIAALEDAARRRGNWRLDNASVYVTLEPCIMCVGAMLEARIEKVVYGASNPEKGAAGGFFNLADYPGFPSRCIVREGILGEECGKILNDFFKSRRRAGKSANLESGL